jgi:RNA polymerase sigma factor (sigma-70 family)
MSVEFGGGSAEVWSVGQAPRDADRQVITNLYDTYAAHLFDYCSGILRNPAAAADAVQDTLIAADALIGKLRDPERLRVWLYCIARRQCLSELSRGSETLTPEELFAGRAGLTAEDTAEFEFPDVEAEALAKETLLVVIAALDGLSDEDQEVVSLAYRHGIGGADLAAVLGISRRRAETLLTGAGTRFEESSDAVSVLRAGWTACPVLETIAGEWDHASPQLTPDLRKRLTRHITSCEGCSRSRGDIFGPELLGALPLAALPAELREQITRTAFDTEPGSYRRSVARRVGKLDDDGFPAAAYQARRNLPKAMAASAALIVLVVGGVMFHQLTSASAVGSQPTAAVGTRTPTPAPSSAPASVPVIQKDHTGRHAPKPFPGQLGPTPTPAPSGVVPVPTPTPTRHSPSPRPTHSKKPSPKPTHSKSPTPTPTPTTPTPTPTTPTPTPTTPTPTPTPPPTPPTPAP